MNEKCSVWAAQIAGIEEKIAEYRAGLAVILKAYKGFQGQVRMKDEMEALFVKIDEQDAEIDKLLVNFPLAQKCIKNPKFSRRPKKQIQAFKIELALADQDLTPEDRELLETDLIPQYQHWLEQSHKHAAPIAPEGPQPKFHGYDLLKHDETTDRYYYEAGQTVTNTDESGEVNEKLSDTPETIAVYKKIAGRRFETPTLAEFVVRIKPALEQIKAMKARHTIKRKSGKLAQLGQVKVSLALIGNSTRANAAIFNQEKRKPIAARF